MDRFHQINPFSKRDSYDSRTIWFYKITTVLTWLLVLVASVWYHYHAPTDGHCHKTIWGRNHPTAFALNPVIVDIYWVVLFILQVGYVWHLFSSNVDYVNAATGVGSHFILNNLLQFAFVMLFVRCHSIWAEVVLVINFFNLSSLYFRHQKLPTFVHIPVVSMPLAWSFVALYWNGAIMFHARTLAARILANIAIWGILVYGLFFLATFKDWTMGFSLSVLTAALGVSEFFTKYIALQWIFAFTIMGVLFLCTLLVAVPGMFGRDIRFGREPVVADDRERAPLLEGN